MFKNDVIQNILDSQLCRFKPHPGCRWLCLVMCWKKLKLVFSVSGSQCDQTNSLFSVNYQSLIMDKTYNTLVLIVFTITGGDVWVTYVSACIIAIIVYSWLVKKKMTPLILISINKTSWQHNKTVFCVSLMHLFGGKQSIDVLHSIEVCSVQWILARENLAKTKMFKLLNHGFKTNISIRCVSAALKWIIMVLTEKCC